MLTRQIVHERFHIWQIFSDSLQHSQRSIFILTWKFGEGNLWWIMIIFEHNWWYILCILRTVTSIHLPRSVPCLKCFDGSWWGLVVVLPERFVVSDLHINCTCIIIPNWYRDRSKKLSDNLKETLLGEFKQFINTEQLQQIEAKLVKKDKLFCFIINRVLWEFRQLKGILYTLRFIEFITKWFTKYFQDFVINLLA